MTKLDLDIEKSPDTKIGAFIKPVTIITVSDLTKTDFSLVVSRCRVGGVKDQAKNPPALCFQARCVQLFAASLKKFPGLENNEVLFDVILSNGLIDTGFALLVFCPAPRYVLKEKCRFT